MPQKGIDKQTVLEAAISMVAEGGYGSFSMHRLAARLGVKTASLYNHVESVAEVNMAVARRAVSELRSALDEAAYGISEPRAALKTLAVAYRQYAHENPELYQVIINLPLLEDRQIMELGKEIIEPMMRPLAHWAGSRQEQLHCARSLRSMLHGFVALEATGYFESAEASADDSYGFMIDTFLNGLPHNTTDKNNQLD